MGKAGMGWIVRCEGEGSGMFGELFWDGYCLQWAAYTSVVSMNYEYNRGLFSFPDYSTVDRLSESEMVQSRFFCWYFTNTMYVFICRISHHLSPTKALKSEGSCGF